MSPLYEVQTAEGYYFQVYPERVIMVDDKLREVFNLQHQNIKKIKGKYSSGNNKLLLVETNRKNYFSFEKQSNVYTLKKLINYQVKRLVSNILKKK